MKQLYTREYVLVKLFLFHLNEKIFHIFEMKRIQ